MFMKKFTITLNLVFALLMSVQLISQNLTEGFETWPPAEWTIVQGPCSPTNDIIQSGSYVHSGSYSARMSSFSSCTNGYNQYMITPELNVTTGDQTLSFWYRKNPSGSETFAVGWSSTGTDVTTDFTWSDPVTNASDTWQQFVKTDLPEGTKYVAIHYYSNYAYYLYLDDFAGPALNISSVPNCALIGSPANEAAEVLETASLNWLSGGGAPAGYYLSFGTDNPPTNIENGSDLGDVITYAPTALEFGTTYYWQVVAYNVNGSAEGCEVWSFTTREEPGMLSGTVTDSDSGLPIIGATVTAEGDAGYGEAETDELGYYEMELAPGDYDVICEAGGYETGGLADFSITILPGQPATLNFSLAPIIGADCTNPILIDAFPYEDLGQTNCGMGDVYDATCLDYYDSGEDIFYSFTLAETTVLNITLDPYTTTYTGIAVLDQCPPPATGCIASVSNSGTSIRTIQSLELVAGTYYIMIDTYASPDCIPEFDLMIEEYIAPILGCRYTVELYDSYGDGWDGNALTVNVNGNIVLNEVTLDSGYGPAIFEFYAETDDVIEFILGTDTYGENSFYVYDANDELVFEDGPYPTGGTILADCGDCQYSVVLEDSYGDGWNGGTLDVIVDGMPVLSGLTIVSGFGPEEFFFTVFTGSVVDFDYTVGGFGSENSYYAYDANGMEVFASGVSGTPVDGQITGDCAAETGTLAGLIIDEMSGLPIEGALITANDGIVDYTTETDEGGAYEMILVTGEYDVTAAAGGYAPGVPMDVLVTINANTTTTLNFGLAPLLGSTCANPILIDALPYQDLGQTNCGLGNNYSTTCLGNYDGGDDIIYELVVDETVAVNIIMDPKTTTYTGMAIFDGCPDVGSCMESTTISGADTLRIDNLLLGAGTYYLMIDTWPAPNCIPEFDLHIEVLIPGTISGLVTDLGTGDPIGGVDVVAEPGGFATFTNALGEYEMDIYGGMYDLSFYHPEYFEVLVDSVNIVSEENTILDVEMLILPVPECASLIYPAENAMDIMPNAVTFSWESGGIVPVDGYKFSLYDFSRNVWVEQEKNLGNVTEYTMDLEWSTYYGVQLQPYNITGINDNCLPMFFNTSLKGTIDGMIVDALSNLPLDGVMIEVEELSPNAGNTWSLASAADGSWNLDWAEGLEGGMYAISYAKYGYEDFFVGNFEVLPSVVTPANVSLEPVTPYALPFVEKWDSENLTAQKWTAGASNWSVDAEEGNPAPTAFFNWTPSTLDYQIMLESYYLDARNEADVFVQFDLYLDNYSINTLEEMILQVYDGTQWNDVAAFDNQILDAGNIEWTTFTYDVSTLAAGNQIKIGFLAQGEYSLNIDGWYIDNITVASSLLEVNPDKVADILFPAEVSVNSFDIVNIGSMPIDWEIDELALPAWVSIDLADGTLAAGDAQTVEVTFDATIAGTGMFSDVILISGDAGTYTAELALELEVLDENGQKIMIPAPGQWGYISTFIDMNAKMTMYEAFADVLDEMEILVGKTGIFWPGMEINTLGEYNTYEGYKMKMNEVGTLAFLGDMVEDQTVSFPAGTFIIPVLSNVPVLAETIFDGQPVDFAFGLDGTIYWPAGGITTLETLYPGYGYLVRFSDDATLDFDVALPKADPTPNTPPDFANATSWNEVYKTGDFHMVGVNAEAVSQLEAGDFVGAFNADGLCTGMTYYDGMDKTLAIPVFANDNTTPQLNGMVSGEGLNFRIYRNNEEFAAEVAYDRNMPNYDGVFVNNGLSVINSLKVGATGLIDNPVSSISVYPNPSDGLFTIDGVEMALEMMVSNAQGQLIMKQSIADSYQLDLTSQPAGLYYIRLVGEQGVKLVKVIKQ